VDHGVGILVRILWKYPQSTGHSGETKDATCRGNPPGRQVDIYWFEKIKYLGVHIVSGKSFTVDASTRIRKFYASANAILHNTKYVNELPHLSLCKSFVLPILTYGCDGLDMSVGNVNRLNVCWNDLYKKNLGFINGNR